MRRLQIVMLVTLLATGALFGGSRAEAGPPPGAAAIGVAAGENTLRQDAAYVCRRVWRCGSYGCGWNRGCYWTPGPYAYAYPYSYPYAYAYRPYWRGYSRYGARPYWRGRRVWR